MTRGRKPIRAAPALRLSSRQGLEHSAVELFADKESFIARETAALAEIRDRLPAGKSVRKHFSDTQLAEIFRKHGFADEEDYELQHYLAFPPERHQ